MGAPAEREEAGGETGGTSQVDTEKVQELQELLNQRDRELQVWRWRSRADNDALIAQETVMMRQFHEIALRYQKLVVENDMLRQSGQASETRTGLVAAQPTPTTAVPVAAAAATTPAAKT